MLLIRLASICVMRHGIHGIWAVFCLVVLKSSNPCENVGSKWFGPRTRGARRHQLGEFRARKAMSARSGCETHAMPVCAIKLLKDYDVSYRVLVQVSESKTWAKLDTQKMAQNSQDSAARNPADHLKKYRWQKGQGSPNPAGARSSFRSRTAIETGSKKNSLRSFGVGLSSGFRRSRKFSLKAPLTETSL